MRGIILATILFFSGFESGDMTEFVSSTGPWSTTVSPLPVFSGGYSITTFGNSLANTPTGLGLTTIAARWMFASSPSLGGNGTSVLFFNAAGTKYINIGPNVQSCIGTACSDERIYWSHNNQTPVAFGTTNLTVQAWNLVEAKCVIDAVVGGCEVKVNGNVEFTSFGTDTSDIVAVDFVQIGPAGAGVSIITQWYDNLMLCSPDYCPPGITIARQGTTGSPTYTAWAKNFCTSGLIENCWSQTPFDATPNATSTVAADAQTMLLHSFATTQSGHGGEVFPPFAALNACKTFMVAKAASGGTLTMRRRLGGVDTDTARTVTTADAGYDDGIWTASSSLINTMEIGVSQGANGVSQQVEDMWTMCDFLPATGSVKHRVIQ